MRVKIKTFGFKLKIDVDSYDKIKQVKYKIKEAHGLDVDRQELYLGGRRLENEKTVKDYNIEDNGEIQLLQIATGGFQIYIRKFRGGDIALQVRSSYTIKKVKELFFEKEGIIVEHQKLIFGGVVLSNDKLVSSYGIIEGNTLHLVNRLHGGFI
ncbi:hypothetical protein RclHR1_05040010 [Rhizophagus clarus]|uniref:Polyubiquitin n=1 Tax=Rhizophagus clarus TaxID=94130 RepID=A0A2Z6SE83_9GLOM|nr:hypothetical protein RclHR1_05040010 [Rhizophagus clarus]GES87514.1 polyubiquitin [Rhizophagus clarus]